MEQLKAAYIQYRWVKALACVGLVLCAVILYSLSGGLPPWAWRFLLSVIPQIPQLWAAQGTAIILPLVGLLLLSLALLILWGILIILAVKIIAHWQQDSYARQRFEQELQEAQMLVDEKFTAPYVATYEEYAEEETQPAKTYPLHTVRLPTAIPAPLQQTFEPPRVSRPTGASRPSADYASPMPTPAYQQGPPTRQPGARRVSVPPAFAQAAGARRNPISDVQTQSLPILAQSAPAMRNKLHLVTPPPLQDRAQPSMPGVHSTTWQAEPGKSTYASWDGAPATSHQRQLTSSGPIEDFEEEEEEDDQDIQDIDTYAGYDSEDESVFSPSDEDVQQGIPLSLVMGIGLDPGIARKNNPNEDSLFAIQGMRITAAGPKPAGLFVIADGMGGHAHGQEASRLAVQSVSDVIVPALLRNVSGSDAADEGQFFLDMLKDGVHRANLAIYRRNRETSSLMGTTITTALVVDTTAYVINIGDSRTYLYRPADGLIQQTRDHSVVARLVETGNIRRDDIYTHPQRNQIYRCLGEHATVEMDTVIIPLQADDILILCSDGLWEMVRDSVMEKIVASSAHRPAQIGTLLIQAALDGGGADNISVVVVGIVQAQE